MSSLVASTQDPAVSSSAEEGIRQFVTMKVGGQLFGIPVLMVQDVLRPPRVTKVPLSLPVILGSINLRGRIVTVVDMRKRLGLEPREKGLKSMHVVVEHKEELYSLVVDSVGEVMSLPLSRFEQSPANLSDQWSSVSIGVYRLEGELLVVLDIDTLLKF